MKKKDVERLCALTEMVWISSSHKLRRKLAAEQAVVAKLNELSKARDQSQHSLMQEQSPDPSTIRATAGWMKWSDQERRKLNIELAQCRAALAAERAHARKAFGRRQAADKIQEAVTRLQRK